MKTGINEAITLILRVRSHKAITTKNLETKRKNRPFQKNRITEVKNTKGTTDLPVQIKRTKQIDIINKKGPIRELEETQETNGLTRRTGKIKIRGLSLTTILLRDQGIVPMKKWVTDLMATQSVINLNPTNSAFQKKEKKMV
jgi:hypothetical protein